MLDRGYPVAEVAERLGVLSTRGRHKWAMAVKSKNIEQQANEAVDVKSEILELRAKLRRIERKRDILKKPRDTSLNNSSEVELHQRTSPRCVVSCRLCRSECHACISRCRLYRWKTNDS